MKVCGQCLEVQPTTEYYARRAKRGDGYQSQCKACDRKSAKEWARSKKGDWENRLHRMALASKRRARDKGWENNMDSKYLLDLLDTQGNVCAVTELPFDLEPSTEHSKNPYAPSIDRIDSAKGYVRGNVQIVLHWYNNAKSTYSDAMVKALCAAVVAEAA